MKFTFTNEFKLSRLDEIVDYLSGPRLWVPHVDYPDYYDWLQKVHTQIKSEKKRAIIALYEKQIVGVTIYQKHEQIRNALEIKNLTVRPDVQGRYVASFLLRNTEYLGYKDFKCSHVLCDAKSHNQAIKAFLLRHKYLPQGTADLYGLNSGDDIIFKKQLDMWKVN